MKWINFLHFYQPVNTDAHIITEASEMSYKRVVRALRENPGIKFTININGSLLIRWEELGYESLIQDIKELMEKGQIELTGTACYHPLLPLIPEEETQKQIKENEQLLKKHFGETFKPRGFFLPEMAYSKNVALIIKKNGYKWIILDEIAHRGKIGDTKTDQVYRMEDIGLDVIYRSRKDSSSYVPANLKKLIDSDKTIVTATDGELYGLRHLDHKGEFERSLKEDGLKTATITEFIKESKERIPTEPVACSWETSEEEIELNRPYSLWNDDRNEIQNKIWELAMLSYRTVNKYRLDDNYSWARWHMVRGFASCTFWWASNKDFSHIFGPQAWNPDEIERGLNEFIRSIRAIEDVASRETKLKAEKLFITIKQLIWEKHWINWKK